jgi:AraC-binding-like domain
MPFDAGTKWSFSTGEMPPDERVASVRGLRERGILHLEPLPDLVVQVEITKYALPGVKILAGTLSGLVQIGSANDPGGQDHLFLGINLTGRSAVRQPGREFELDSGEAALFSCIDEGFSAYRPTPVSFLGVRVAHKVVVPLGVRLDDGRMRSISPDTGCLRLLTTYLRFICSWEATDGSELPATMAAHVADLVALIAHTDLGAPAAEICGVRAARLQAVKSEITRNLGDYELTVAAVAARHAVTPRYIHKLFERRQDFFRVRSRPPPLRRVPTSDKPTSSESFDRLGCLRLRLWRPLVLQSHVPPTLQRDADGGAVQGELRSK